MDKLTPDLEGRQEPVRRGEQAAASEALPGAVGKAPLRRAHRAPRPGPAAAGAGRYDAILCWQRKTRAV